jgi:hypothetical protein
VHAPAQALQERRRRIDVERAEGHARPAEVARVGVVEQSRPEHLRPERERRLLGAQVDGRERDEVPKPAEDAGGLPVAGEEGGERLRVEARIVEVEPAQCEDRPPDPGPLAGLEVPVAGE